MVKLLGYAASMKALAALNVAALAINKKRSKNVAEAVRDTQEELAPKGETLDLSGSIDIDEKQYTYSCWYRIGPSDTLHKTKEGIPYSVLQEFGISQMAAQPYVRPSADAHRGDLEREYRDGFSKL